MATIWSFENAAAETGVGAAALMTYRRHVRLLKLLRREDAVIYRAGFPNGFVLALVPTSG